MPAHTGTCLHTQIHACTHGHTHPERKRTRRRARALSTAPCLVRRSWAGRAPGQEEGLWSQHLKELQGAASVVDAPSQCSSCLGNGPRSLPGGRGQKTVWRGPVVTEKARLPPGRVFVHFSLTLRPQSGPFSRLKHSIHVHMCLSVCRGRRGRVEAAKDVFVAVRKAWETELYAPQILSRSPQ